MSDPREPVDFDRVLIQAREVERELGRALLSPREERNGARVVDVALDRIDFGAGTTLVVRYCYLDRRGVLRGRVILAAMRAVLPSTYMVISDERLPLLREALDHAARVLEPVRLSRGAR